MSWKNWPYWLRGAIIFGTIGIVAAFWEINETRTYFMCFGCFTPFSIIPFYLLLRFLPATFTFGLGLNPLAIFLTNFISSILVGAVLGFLYGINPKMGAKIFAALIVLILFIAVFIFTLKPL